MTSQMKAKIRGRDKQANRGCLCRISDVRKRNTIYVKIIKKIWKQGSTYEEKDRGCKNMGFRGCKKMGNKGRRGESMERRLEVEVRVGVPRGKMAT